MGNHSRIESYLSELEGKSKIKLEDRDIKVLVEILHAPRTVYDVTKIINKKFEVKVPLDGDDNHGGDDSHEDTPSYRVVYLIAGPLSRPAVKKRFRKLVRYGLIKEIKDEKKLPRKARFAFHQKGTKPFEITDYGLFCYLLYEKQPRLAVLRRYWHYKVMRLLLSSYFEKQTVLGRHTPYEYFMIIRFLLEALSIIKQRVDIIDNVDEAEIYVHEVLNKSEKGKKYRTWKEEQISELEDDLLWHAKSLALRLMVDTASNDKDKSRRSLRLLGFLMHDKKFVKLVKGTMHEILSYYRGGKLLELDKLHLFMRDVRRMHAHAFSCPILI
jgi:hypothetical protein